jgi:hypothetical protein
MVTEQAQETWNRREDESAKEYRAFMTYLRLDADRSVLKVSRKLAVSRTLISRWCMQFQWVTRSGDYDRHISELRLARMAATRERLADRTVALAAKMFDVVGAKMNGLRKRKLDAHAVARLFCAASQAIQNVFGDETPLAQQTPKIVVLALHKNQPRDFDRESEERGDSIQ